MAINATRRRMHRRLTRLPGLQTVRRPVSPGSDEQFDLYYVRDGRKSAHPVVIIPGGPGMASVLAYRGFRQRAVDAGLDVIMVEHRGIGLSRLNDAGENLPPEALTVEQVVDDIAAVLDDARVESATIFGSSYGTYIAAGVGVRHPHRVQAMILDSPLLSRHDVEIVRDTLRHVLLKGDRADTVTLAPKMRRLVDRGIMTPAAGQLAATVYGYGGAELLERQLDLLLTGRKMLWRTLSRVGKIVTRKVPYSYEVDLVGRIAFRELDYGAEPDGLPLDPAVAYRETFDTTETFVAEPYDLVAEMPKFDWPTVVIAGGRDLVTPPAVAERIATLLPHPVLVNMPTMAHAALDFREPAALAIAKSVCDGEMDELAHRAPDLDAIQPPLALRLLWEAVDLAARAELATPRLPQLPRITELTHQLLNQLPQQLRPQRPGVNSA
ncbi:alpha/beta hydrolase [Mycobacterium bourgelatii]|uniref:alpha/beta hydrolase n=1 Tax=Mycobacterium bourgelatii TaxID=1273442 RepID=UPI0013D10CAD|nr:alpha/beta fold hydrolase [Mycobacterium bourgelatii]MCV6977572.1 alpha/beta fold hydrolase [Mycobacterium bourgelatii]